MERREFMKLGGLGSAAAVGVAAAACSPSTAANPVPHVLSGGELIEALWPAQRRRRLVSVEPRNPAAPTSLPVAGSRSALIVGGGIAGLSAALELADAGYAVTICEAAPQFGGRLATRELDPGVGETFRVEHGLHMWFDNYRVFSDIRTRLGVDHHFRPYDVVNFIFRDYEPEQLRSDPKVFPLNLVGIIDRSPNLDWPDVFASLGMVLDLLQFNFDGLYDRLDQITFRQWMDRVAVNQRFRDVVMGPAAHVTLNRQADLSAAEMLLYQHLYFTSQPFAFDREITTVDHGTAVIDPWIARLRSLGATCLADSRIAGLRFAGDRAVGIVGETTDYDWVVLATDVNGTKAILAGSIAADAAATRSLIDLRERIAPLATAPPYRILRVWFDRPLDPGRPDLIETPQHDPVALICQFHQLEDEPRAWAERTGGAVIEFHLYALEGPIATAPDDDVWSLLRPTVLEVVPELESAVVLGYTIGNYENFTSFGVGIGAVRPFPDSPELDGITNLRLCGDWVAAPAPSALMERAVMTGRLAANACRFVDGVREVGYDHVSPLGPLV